MTTKRVQLHAPLVDVRPVNHLGTDVDIDLDDGSVCDATSDVNKQHGPNAPLSNSSFTDADQERRQLRQVLDHIADVLTEINQQREQNLGEMQQACVQLSVAIASRLVRSRIDANQMAVGELVAEVIAKLKNRTPISIILNPLDLTLLQSTALEDDPPWMDETKIRLLSDESIPRGNCRADGDEISFLYDIDLQLRELQQQLVQGLDDAQTERRQPANDDRNLRRFPDRRSTA